MFALTYPLPGRGAFPLNGAGGTLNFAGTGPGPYYRAPAAGSSVKMPGSIAAMAIRTGTSCPINAYGVHRAVKALQLAVGVAADGILGPDTNAAFRVYQVEHHLAIDGVIGPQTCRSLYEPLVLEFVEISGFSVSLRSAALGTIAFESNWDHGAVGTVTPEDLGLGQINGPAHPDMSVDARFNPVSAIPYVVSFINGNFEAMNNDVDAAILAYNLGIGGARSWINAGRPRTFRGTDTWAYIAKIKSLGAYTPT